MKRAGQIFLVAAMLCGSVGYAGAARAANEYSFTLETKGDAASFDISSPENATIPVAWVTIASSLRCVARSPTIAGIVSAKASR